MCVEDHYCVALSSHGRHMVVAWRLIYTITFPIFCWFRGRSRVQQFRFCTIAVVIENIICVLLLYGPNFGASPYLNFSPRLEISIAQQLFAVSNVLCVAKHKADEILLYDSFF